MTYTLTKEDLVETPRGDWLYIGPLKDALNFAAEDVDAPRVLGGGIWEVTLLNGDNWGRGDTAELARRYALGAYFGPVDEEFQPIPLHDPKRLQDMARAWMRSHGQWTYDDMAADMVEELGEDYNCTIEDTEEIIRLINVATVTITF